MSDTNWYADASLVHDTHVFAAGSLAQCVRRWTRLSEDEKAGSIIKLGGRTGGQASGLPVLGRVEITELASSPELRKV